MMIYLMDEKIYYLIAGLIINVTIACVNEFMPLEEPIHVCGLPAQGEKGIITTTLVWLGLKKSRVEAGHVLHGTNITQAAKPH